MNTLQKCKENVHHHYHACRCASLLHVDNEFIVFLGHQESLFRMLNCSARIVCKNMLFSTNQKQNQICPLFILPHLALKHNSFITIYALTVIGQGCYKFGLDLISGQSLDCLILNIPNKNYTGL